MKTIQLELSDAVYDQVMGVLKLLPKEHCHIQEDLAINRQALGDALDTAVRANAFADIKASEDWDVFFDKVRYSPTQRKEQDITDLASPRDEIYADRLF